MAGTLLNPKSRFYNFCRKLEIKLPSDLSFTKENDNEEYVWIANKDYSVGGYPLHYEVRFEMNKVHVEIHYESVSIILYNGNDLKSEVDIFLKSFGLVPVLNSAVKTAHYNWYEFPDSSIDIDETNLEDYLQSVINILNRFLNTKIDNQLSIYMNEVWG